MLEFIAQLKLCISTKLQTINNTQLFKQNDIAVYSGLVMMFSQIYELFDRQWAMVLE